MKTAYTNIIDYPEMYAGVHNKIIAQKRACEAVNLPIDFHILCNERPVNEEPGISYHLLPKSGKTLAKLGIEAKGMVELMQGYDVVINRIAYFSAPFIKAFRKRNFLLISENHVKFWQQRKVLKQYKLMAYEWFFKKRCLNLCDGIVGVTDELGQYVVDHGFRHPENVTAITNGIDVASIPLTGFRPFDGKRLDLCIVSGLNAPWHGLSRVLAGLEQYAGDVEIVLHVVGKVQPEAVKSRGNVRIKCHGVQYGADLDAIYAEMNMAIAPLAHHRIRMKQACNLKTRDYVARGLPFFMAYDDPDVHSEDEFCLRFPADEGAIDMRTVVDFAADLTRGKSAEEVSARMREVAEGRLDWKHKMRQYHEFAQRLYREKNG